MVFVRDWPDFLHFGRGVPLEALLRPGNPKAVEQAVDFALRQSELMDPYGRSPGHFFEAVRHLSILGDLDGRAGAAASETCKRLGQGYSEWCGGFVALAAMGMEIIQMAHEAAAWQPSVELLTELYPTWWRRVQSGEGYPQYLLAASFAFGKVS